jgi:hypothetical protein
MSKKLDVDPIVSRLPWLRGGLVRLATFLFFSIQGKVKDYIDDNDD